MLAVFIVEYVPSKNIIEKGPIHLSKNMLDPDKT